MEARGELNEVDEANLRDLISGYFEGLKGVDLPGWSQMDDKEKEDLINKTADLMAGEVARSEEERSKETEEKIEKQQGAASREPGVIEEPSEEEQLEETSGVAAVEGSPGAGGPWNLKKRDFYV